MASFGNFSPKFVAREWTAADPNTVHTPTCTVESHEQRARDSNMRPHINRNLLFVSFGTLKQGRKSFTGSFFMRICRVPTPRVVLMLHKIIRVQLADQLAGI